MGEEATYGWDSFLTGRDRDIAATAGYGARMGPGLRPALLLIDVTYAFCGEREQMNAQTNRVYRNACGAAAWDAVDVMVRLLGAARAGGVPVVYTKPVRARPDGRNRGRWLDKNRRGGEDMAPPPRAYDIVDAIAPIAADLVIEKEKPSGFFGTPLSAYLTDWAVDTVLLCGGVTSGCIRSTAIDGFSHNYRVGVVREATFDRIEASHWINLFDLDQKYADVIPADGAAAYLTDRTLGRWA